MLLVFDNYDVKFSMEVGIAEKDEIFHIYKISPYVQIHLRYTFSKDYLYHEIHF